MVYQVATDYEHGQFSSSGNRQLLEWAASREPQVLELAEAAQHVGRQPGHAGDYDLQPGELCQLVEARQVNPIRLGSVLEDPTKGSQSGEQLDGPGRSWSRSTREGGGVTNTHVTHIIVSLSETLK